MKQKTFWWVIILSILYLVFFIKAALIIDPDFGWHYKMGELIANQGIPKTDPFSYTMASFPFIDHEWLSNIFIYQLYQNFGYISLALIYSILAVISLLILLPKKSFQFSLASLILGYAVLLPFSGVRPQAISWVLLALLLKVLLDIKLWQKFKFCLPILVFIWANLHGSFALSLLLLLIFVAIQFWQNRKSIKSDLLVLFLSILATFANPYGPEIYVEIWSQVSDHSLKWRIGEWQPSFMRFDATYLLLTAISLGFLTKYFRKYNLVIKVFYSLFLLMSISSLRHTPFFIIISLYVVLNGFSFLLEDLKKIKGALWRFNRVYLYFALTSLMLISIQSFLVYQNQLVLNEKDYYPKKALEYLKTHPFEGNIFNDYGWGGYLIWKYPEKKVFIDGRMPSWRRETAPPEESTYSMDEYYKVYFEEGEINPIAQKYNIKAFLIHPSDNSTRKNQFFNMIIKLDNQLTQIFLGKQKGHPNLKSKLITAGWIKVYQDNTAVIYISP